MEASRKYVCLPKPATASLQSNGKRCANLQEEKRRGKILASLRIILSIDLLIPAGSCAVPPARSVPSCWACTQISTSL